MCFKSPIKRRGTNICLNSGMVDFFVKFTGFATTHHMYIKAIQKFRASFPYLRSTFNMFVKMSYSYNF